MSALRFVACSRCYSGLLWNKCTSSKTNRKTTQQLNARFDYDKYESSVNQAYPGFENGELSVDAYVMQMAYSMYGAGQA